MLRLLFGCFPFLGRLFGNPDFSEEPDWNQIEAKLKANPSIIAALEAPDNSEILKKMRADIKLTEAEFLRHITEPLEPKHRHQIIMMMSTRTRRQRYARDWLLDYASQKPHGPVFQQLYHRVLIDRCKQEVEAMREELKADGFSSQA